MNKIKKIIIPSIILVTLATALPIIFISIKKNTNKTTDVSNGGNGNGGGNGGNNGNGGGNPKIIENQITEKILKSINIVEKPIKNTNNLFFLGEKGLKKLVTRVENELSYGPEIFGLKQITIGETIENSNGLFNYDSREIFISHNIIKDLNSLHNGIYPSFKKGQKIKDDFLALKVDAIFQVLVHEYGHFLGFSYVEQQDQDQKNASKTINIIGDEGENLYWNKYFVDNFMDILNYDKPYVSIFKTLPPIFQEQGTKYVPITRDFDQKAFFENINLKTGDINKLDKISETHVFSTNDSQGNIYDFDFLKYVYSFPELLTRKYQQLTMPFRGGKIINYNAEGYYHNQNRNGNKSIFLEDAQLYQNNLQVRSQKEIFMADGPFEFNPRQTGKKKSEKLFNLFKKIMGYQKDLSIIFNINKNTLSITSNQTTFRNKDDKYIKMGGYFSPANFDKMFKNNVFNNEGWIGIKENNVFKAIKKISILKNNFRVKNSLISPTRKPLSSSESKFFWITDDGDGESWNEKNKTIDLDDYLNVNEVLNKKIYISNDTKGTSTFLLKTFKGEEQKGIYGKVDSFYHDSRTNPNQIYTPVKDNDFFTIKKN